MKEFHWGECNVWVFLEYLLGESSCGGVSLGCSLFGVSDRVPLWGRVWRGCIIWSDL